MQRPSSDWPRAAPRSVRSREGCLTCKRRKVKCDELRPQCSHCERLNFECQWRAGGAGGSEDGSRSGKNSESRKTQQRSTTVRTEAVQAEPATSVAASTTAPSVTAPAFQAPLNAVNQIFDFASFMWDADGIWQETSSGMMDGIGGFERGAAEVAAGFDGGARQPAAGTEVAAAAATPAAPESTVPSEVPFLAAGADNHRLMDYFMHAVIPPILAEIETQKRWLVLRRVLVGRANTSRMVRWAILAFSDVILTQREGPQLASAHDHYTNALAEVEAALAAADLGRASALRENLLATLFFLSYVDLLQGRMATAPSNLQRAHVVLRAGDASNFSAMERQFLLWLRLLDARAVSAGGEGLFLSPDGESMLVETPPSSALDGANSTSDDVEDVLFQLLYQPGIVFFQKVQSFMGRISRIDPWHRPRGTVEDEIEVMNIGVAITADLRALYDGRPVLMDYAVSGRLTAAHVSAQLAFAVTRSFRTYLANYHASKVHLHRVAYKTLPLTHEAADALLQIRRLAHLLVEGLDADETLPVNMLWPLLMLGSEEQDPDKRAWIRAQILRMEKVAGNSRITAQVLEEVQARQDSSKTRVDIRSVMHDIFNASFAIM